MPPVGSFPCELNGLFDISGNVTEWVLDEEESTIERPGKSQAQLRGPSWLDGTKEKTSFTFLRQPYRVLRLGHAGFRVVLELDESR